MRLLCVILLFVLAGCASSDQFQLQGSTPPPQATAVAPQAIPRAAPLSPAATAAAPAGTNVSSGELMDCVTQSCKINCSPKVKKQFQPKWCARFKPPIE
jgi:hypothetical protein